MSATLVASALLSTPTQAGEIPALEQRRRILAVLLCPLRGHSLCLMVGDGDAAKYISWGRIECPLLRLDPTAEVFAPQEHTLQGFVMCSAFGSTISGIAAFKAFTLVLLHSLLFYMKGIRYLLSPRIVVFALRGLGLPHSLSQQAMQAKEAEQQLLPADVTQSESEPAPHTEA